MGAGTGVVGVTPGSCCCSWHWWASGSASRFGQCSARRARHNTSSLPDLHRIPPWRPSGCGSRVARSEPTSTRHAPRNSPVSSRQNRHRHQHNQAHKRPTRCNKCAARLCHSDRTDRVVRAASVLVGLGGLSFLLVAGTIAFGSFRYVTFDCGSVISPKDPTNRVVARPIEAICPRFATGTCGPRERLQTGRRYGVVVVIASVVVVCVCVLSG